MAKDPRFNFYPDNYEGGTDFFTLEQDGAYLRLLMLQFRNGSFTERQAVLKLMQRCPESPKNAQKLWEFIRHKFETDGSVYWNKRMRSEIDKSTQYAENQSERAKARWEKEKIKDASAYTNAHTEHIPKSYQNDASNSNSNTSINTTTKTSSNKNTAEADVFVFERNELISELNSLAGREFDPDAQYFRKAINARIKQYGVPDLIDMIRFIVYKRKGSDFEQFLKPDTIFRPEKCASYMADMIHHRKNGLMPKKDIKPNGLKSGNEIMQEVLAAQARRRANGE